MGEFIFVHLIDDKPEGTDLGLSIPLHATLLHWFETEHTSDEIYNVANAAFADSDAVETISTHADMFGPDNDIPVMRLERTPELLSLHLLLLNSMSRVGAVFDQRWVGENNWNPHVTDKQGRNLQAGYKLRVDNISFIEKRKLDRHRVILGRMTLGR